MNSEKKEGKEKTRNKFRERKVREKGVNTYINRSRGKWVRGKKQVSRGGARKSPCVCGVRKRGASQGKRSPAITRLLA